MATCGAVSEFGGVRCDVNALRDALMEECRARQRDKSELSNEAARVVKDLTKQIEELANGAGSALCALGGKLQSVVDAVENSRRTQEAESCKVSDTLKQLNGYQFQLAGRMQEIWDNLKGDIERLETSGQWRERCGALEKHVLACDTKIGSQAERLEAHLDSVERWRIDQESARFEMQDWISQELHELQQKLMENQQVTKELEARMEAHVPNNSSPEGNNQRNKSWQFGDFFTKKVASNLSENAGKSATSVERKNEMTTSIEQAINLLHQKVDDVNNTLQRSENGSLPTTPRQRRRRRLDADSPLDNLRNISQREHANSILGELFVHRERDLEQKENLHCSPGRDGIKEYPRKEQKTASSDVKTSENNGGESGAPSLFSGFSMPPPEIRSNVTTRCKQAKPPAFVNRSRW